MKTTIAVAVNETSPVTTLDFCTHVRIAVVEDGRVTARHNEVVGTVIPSLRAGRLRALGIDTVLCGALSNPLSMMLWHNGIQVVAGLTGDADVLIEGYAGNELNAFSTPDFRPRFLGGAGCRRRFRGGRNR